MSQFIEMLQSSETKMSLESICSYIGKGITPKYVDVSTIATVNQACVHWDGQRLENVKYHNTDISVKKRILQEGDVLLNATGNGTLGRSCVFHCPTDNKTYINDGHVIALNTDRNVICPEVLNEYFSLPDTQGEIYRQYVTGSTNQVDIVFTDIKKMMIPIPLMEHQTRFVNIKSQADKSGSVLQHMIAC
jgi:type I restriction enzyme S subunit